MKDFIIKLLILIIGSLTLLFFLIFLIMFKEIKSDSFRNMPLNNVSNSICFRAKVDHLFYSKYFKDCTFLIAGSSMALNNISGSIIADQRKEIVYNISSWGTGTMQYYNLLGKMNLSKIKHLLFVFNNDFKLGDYEIDVKATIPYTQQKKFLSSWSFFIKFNAQTFLADWKERSRLNNINNDYTSLKFDKTGSVQLEREGFVINEKRWNTYHDTSGFSKFYVTMNKIDSICKQKEINLIIVYTPNRKDLLTSNNLLQNQTLSQIMKSRFGNSFIDLKDIKIPPDQFCDGSHLFKDGAEAITKLILDSINARKTLIFEHPDKQ